MLRSAVPGTAQLKVTTPAVRIVMDAITLGQELPEGAGLVLILLLLLCKRYLVQEELNCNLELEALVLGELHHSLACISRPLDAQFNVHSELI